MFLSLNVLHTVVNNRKLLPFAYDVSEKPWELFKLFQMICYLKKHWTLSIQIMGDELNSVSIQVIYSSIRYIKVYSKLLLHNVAMLPIEVKNRKIILKPLNIL